MEQLHIYDYLKVTSDPLFNQLEKLNKEQTISIKDTKISLNNFGVYEVSTSKKHEGFRDLNSCYKYLMKSDRDF